MESESIRRKSLSVTKSIVSRFAPAEADIVDEAANDYFAFGGGGTPATREQALSGAEHLLLTSVVLPIVVEVLKDRAKKSVDWVVEQLGKRRAPLPERQREIAKHVIEQLNDDA